MSDRKAAMGSPALPGGGRRAGKGWWGVLSASSIQPRLQHPSPAPPISSRLFREHEARERQLRRPCQRSPQQLN